MTLSFNAFGGPSDLQDKIIKARQLLGVDESATLAVLKKAYRRKISAAHPDRNHDSNAGDKTTELNNAYELLESIHPESKSNTGKGKAKTASSAAESTSHYQPDAAIDPEFFEEVNKAAKDYFSNASFEQLIYDRRLNESRDFHAAVVGRIANRIRVFTKDGLVPLQSPQMTAVLKHTHGKILNKIQYDFVNMFLEETKTVLTQKNPHLPEVYLETLDALLKVPSLYSDRAKVYQIFRIVRDSLHMSPFATPNPAPKVSEKIASITSVKEFLDAPLYVDLESVFNREAYSYLNYDYRVWSFLKSATPDQLAAFTDITLVGHRSPNGRAHPDVQLLVFDIASRFIFIDGFDYQEFDAVIEAASSQSQKPRLDYIKSYYVKKNKQSFVSRVRNFFGRANKCSSVLIKAGS